MALTDDTTRKRWVHLKVMSYPPGFKDAAEVLSHPAGPEMFQRMIDTAQPALTWLISSLDTRHDLDSPKGAIDACEDVVDMLLRQHPIPRFRYARELAAKLDVPIEGVWEMLQDAVLEREQYWQTHPAEQPDRPPRQARTFPGFRHLDTYGETAYFDCPFCGSDDGAKASKPLDLWHCVVCDASGKASALQPPPQDISVWGWNAI